MVLSVLLASVESLATGPGEVTALEAPARDDTLIVVSLAFRVDPTEEVSLALVASLVACAVGYIVNVMSYYFIVINPLRNFFFQTRYAIIFQLSNLQ